MRKIISFLLCTAMVFLIGCSNSSSGGSNNIENTGSNLEDVIIGTWDVPWTSEEDYTFRSDGSVKLKHHNDKYEIDGNMLYIYSDYNVFLRKKNMRNMKNMKLRKILYGGNM